MSFSIRRESVNGPQFQPGLEMSSQDKSVEGLKNQPSSDLPAVRNTKIDTGEQFSRLERAGKAFFAVFIEFPLSTAALAAAAIFGLCALADSVFLGTDFFAMAAAGFFELATNGYEDVIKNLDEAVSGTKAMPHKAISEKADIPLRDMSTDDYLKNLRY